MHGNRTRDKLLAGKHVHVLGGHNHTAATIDFIGPLGFDGFWIEGEHAGVTFDKIGDVSRACDLWGISSVMRVHDNNAGLIGRSLDCGVNGIVVPHVSNKEAAENVVKATRFAPIGMLIVGVLADQLGAVTGVLILSSVGILSMAMTMIVWPEMLRVPLDA